MCHLRARRSSQHNITRLTLGFRVDLSDRRTLLRRSTNRRAWLTTWQHWASPRSMTLRLRRTGGRRQPPQPTAEARLPTPAARPRRCRCRTRAVSGSMRQSRWRPAALPRGTAWPTGALASTSFTFCACGWLARQCAGISQGLVCYMCARTCLMADQHIYAKLSRHCSSQSSAERCGQEVRHSTSDAGTLHLMQALYI